MLLSASDVFVLPSYTEGFPNVIIEAMAMGKPIIATSVGAIPEMLDEGCGVVVPPKDADSLQKALQKVCNFDSDCGRLSVPKLNSRRDQNML